MMRPYRATNWYCTRCRSRLKLKCHSGRDTIFLLRLCCSNVIHSEPAASILIISLVQQSYYFGTKMTYYSTCSWIYYISFAYAQFCISSGIWQINHLNGINWLSSAFQTSSHSKGFTLLSHIHPFIHTPIVVPAMQGTGQLVESS